MRETHWHANGRLSRISQQKYGKYIENAEGASEINWGFLRVYVKRKNTSFSVTFAKFQSLLPSPLHTHETRLPT